MKAFVLKDDRGEVIRAWLVRFGLPHLSLAERDLIERSGRMLEEVSIDEALRSAGRKARQKCRTKDLVS
jgi:hypothetical protein